MPPSTKRRPTRLQVLRVLTCASSLCLSSGGLAQTAPATAPAVPGSSVGGDGISADPEVLEQARNHFRQGVAFADAGNCDAAVAEFEEAYRIVPRPNALYNMGQCEERLFRYDLAIATYKRYLEVAPDDAEDRPAVQAALKTLANLLGIVHITSNVPAEVWVDDRLAGASPGDVYVPAGGHSLELRAKGYIPRRSEVKLAGRQEVSVRLELDKAQTTVEVTETTGISPTLFFIAASATVVSAAVGGVFALRVKSLQSDAEQLESVDPARAPIQKDMQGAEVTADVFFGAAVVLGLGSTIIAFMTEWEEPRNARDTQTANTPAVSFAPSVGPRAFGLTLSGVL